MRQGEDDDFLWRNDVEDGVRELEHDLPPNLPIDHGRVSRELLDEPDRFANFVEEPVTETSRDFVVVVEGFG
jgi:hypothetical protein